MMRMFDRRLSGAVLAALLLHLLSASASAQAGKSSTTGQDYLVRVWGTDEDLLRVEVKGMVQTPDGYLWIGTVMAGVVRFDGVRFTSFTSVNTREVLGTGVSSLMVDYGGKLWLRGYGGSLVTWTPRGLEVAASNIGRPERLLWSAPGKMLFAKNDGQLLQGTQQHNQWQWESRSLPDVAPQPDLCADSDGNVWYIAADRSIRTWQDGQMRSLGTAPELNGQRVTVLCADSSGRIWAGTDQSLACWRNGRFETMTPTNGETKLSVKRIIPVRNRGLWVETENRMRRCEERRWVAESEVWAKELGGIVRLQFAIVDMRGGLWAGHGNLGLMHLDPDGTFHRLTTRDGLPSDNVSFAFADREGSIWAGYDRGPLVQLRPRTFLMVGAEHGLGDTLPTTICEDREGAIWMGTLSGSVERFKDGKCTVFALPGVAASHYSTVGMDTRGRIWSGTQGAGVFRFEEGQFHRVLNRRQIDSDVRLMYASRDGRLWIGTLNSMLVLDGAALTRLHSTEEKEGFPTAIAETRDGTIWFGTSFGNLFRWKGAGFERVELPEVSKLGRVCSLCPTEDGGLWIGTSLGGLLRLRDGVFRRYTVRDGLPADGVVQVLTDAQENLWLATALGMSRIERSVLARFDRGDISSLSCSIYDRTGGLLTLGASTFQPNCFRALDGTLWFAMVRGAAAFRPDAVRRNPLPPTVAIEEVLVNGRPVWPTKAGAVISSAAMSESEPAGEEEHVVRIGPGRPDLEVRYTGLSFTSPEGVRFRYRLRGLENDWSSTDNRRAVVYRAVPPGVFTFEVGACNSDGAWNEQTVALKIVLEPHFYETTWFLTIVVVAAATGLGLTTLAFARRRAHRRIAELKRQGDLERERTRIAQDLHDDLGAGLTEIGLLTSLAQRPSTRPLQGQAHLRHVIEKSREMVTALDEIVWSVNPKHDSVAALGRYFSEYAQQFLDLSSTRCRFEADDHLPTHPLDSDQRHNLLLAFKEALTNVVRHSQAAEVCIHIAVRDGTLEVVVEDNGKGTVAAVATGQADGLANMTRRLKQIGGRCHISSVPGVGTTVRLILPLGKAAGS
jgi:signal transduction histidine kinase/ligand-binding sensor domain-containing protein